MKLINPNSDYLVPIMKHIAAVLREKWLCSVVWLFLEIHLKRLRKVVAPQPVWSGLRWMPRRYCVRGRWTI